MATNRIEGDTYFNGNVGSSSMTLPSGTVTNNSIIALAGIQAEKLEHQHKIVYAQGSAVTAADARNPVFVVTGLTADIISIKAGSVAANVGDSTVAVDILKNGTTVLSGPISLDSGDAAYDLVSGTISVATLAQDDVLEVNIDATIGTGTLALGLFVIITLHELAQ